VSRGWWFALGVSWLGFGGGGGLPALVLRGLSKTTMMYWGCGGLSWSR
jgi:hypothetical protein